MILSTLICAFILCLVLYNFLGPDPAPIHGIYQQKGKWYHLKYWVMCVLFKLRQRQNKNRKQVDGKNAGWGMRSRNSIEDMDRAQVLPKEHPQAVDAVYFNAADEHGTYMVAATARRHEGLVQTLLYIRVPGLGMLELPSFPDTSLYTDKEQSFSAGGLELKPVEAMKKWKMSFKGAMRLIPAQKEGTESDQEEQSESESLVHVEFDLDWAAAGRMFDFDTDLHWKTICDSMAREKWSKEFFKQLEVAHQTHYEQFGIISGTVNIESYGQHKMNVRGVRDHSYGNIRNWYDLHRYGLQYLTLEDGTDICYGMICMPRTMSRIPMGYVIKPDGQLYAMTSTDFDLYKFGEDGSEITDWEIKFTTDEGTYHVKGHVLQSRVFYMGLDWDARVVERFCKFEVNGLKGWGVSEWEYCYHGSKPEIYKKKAANDETVEEVPPVTVTSPEAKSTDISHNEDVENSHVEE